MSSLTVSGLNVRYGGVRAVADVHLEVHSGEIVGLIGPNGAGKTSFVDAVTGFASSTGDVMLGELPLTGSPPHVRARRGLGRTWQGADLFDDLTVEENLRVAERSPKRRKGSDGETSGEPSAVETVLAKLDLARVRGLQPDALSHGQRKLVGVGRALMARPAVLLLDEPAAGLDTNESRELGATLREIASSGVGVLLIDHDMGLVLEVCDRLVVLNFGQVIAQGSPREVRDDARVVEAYLGGSHA